MKDFCTADVCVVEDSFTPSTIHYFGRPQVLQLVTSQRSHSIHITFRNPCCTDTKLAQESRSYIYVGTLGGNVFTIKTSLGPALLGMIR